MICRKAYVLRHFYNILLRKADSFMVDKIKNVFSNEGIKHVGAIPGSDMNIINHHLLPKDAEIKSCIVFLVPYKTEDEVLDSYCVSAYARAMDYHSYFNKLYERIIPILENIFTGEQFFGFADHSPVNEKLAAATAGIGIIGRNSLLINSEYGSFVFIGSLLTTLSLPVQSSGIQVCSSCSRCVDACPAGAISEKGIIAERCLSSISQKKNKTPDELLLLKNNKTVWGCDICQNVCPLNSGKALTEIQYFHINRLNNITEELIETMSDDVFNTYPFSWRGKVNIINNIKNCDCK
jgi:epoxyqueuosine reductase